MVYPPFFVVGIMTTQSDAHEKLLTFLKEEIPKSKDRGEKGFILYLDGTIGCGKSTTIIKVYKAYSQNADLFDALVVPVLEPSDEWHLLLQFNLGRHMSFTEDFTDLVERVASHVITAKNTLAEMSKTKFVVFLVERTLANHWYLFRQRTIQEREYLERDERKCSRAMQRAINGNEVLPIRRYCIWLELTEELNFEWVKQRELQYEKYYDSEVHRRWVGLRGKVFEALLHTYEYDNVHFKILHVDKLGHAVMIDFNKSGLEHPRGNRMEVVDKPGQGMSQMCRAGELKDVYQMMECSRCMLRMRCHVESTNMNSCPNCGQADQWC